MTPSTDLSKIDALILCGGLGTRFREVSDSIPKILAPLDENTTFLDIMLDRLEEAGVRTPILCTGYLSEIIEEYCHKKGRSVRFSKEETPMGTGGAIAHAYRFVYSNPFLVFNGDSLCSVSLRELVKFHIDSRAWTTLTVLATEDPSFGGRVVIGKDGRVWEFIEKGKEVGAGLVNAGIYVMSNAMFECMPNRSFSLEKDLLPNICTLCTCFETHSELIDIGTLQRFKHIDKVRDFSLL